MNLKSLAPLLVVLLVTPAVLAQNTAQKAKEVPTEEVPGLVVSEGVSDQIYKQTTMSVSSSGMSAVTVDSFFRVFRPEELSLRNNYFEVAYADNVRTIPGFIVGPELPLAGGKGGGRLSSFFHIGYSYVQGVYDAETDSGLAVRDAVELQWVPLQAGLEATTRSFTTQGLAFGFLASGGVDWLTQSGELDGMNQTYWIPRYEVGPSFTIFSHQQPDRGGFDGIRVSAVVYRSFSSPQINRGIAADIGARYAF